MTIEEKDKVIDDIADVVASLYSEGVRNILASIKEEILKKKITNISNAQVKSFNNGIDEAAKTVNYFTDRISEFVKVNYNRPK